MIINYLNIDPNLYIVCFMYNHYIFIGFERIETSFFIIKWKENLIYMFYFLLIIENYLFFIL